jgi:hypothetical protein
MRHDCQVRSGNASAFGHWGLAERVKGIEPPAKPGRAKRTKEQGSMALTAKVERVKGIEPSS